MPVRMLWCYFSLRPRSMSHGGTEQFARLTDGLIFTYGEFKDVAVLNNITAKIYPKNWSEFMELNSALNV